jgi:hypothetical protein
MKRHYRPEDPNPGDLVTRSPIWEDPDLHGQRPPLERASGVVLSRIGPDSSGGHFQYKIRVQLASGETIQTHSHEWTCLRTMQEMCANRLKEQTAVIAKLEDMVRKIETGQDKSSPDPEIEP